MKKPPVKFTLVIPVQSVRDKNKETIIGIRANNTPPKRLGRRKTQALLQPDLPFVDILSPLKLMAGNACHIKLYKENKSKSDLLLQFLLEFAVFPVPEWELPAAGLPVKEEKFVSWFIRI